MIKTLSVLAKRTRRKEALDHLSVLLYMIVYYACIFLFDFTCCHAICLLVLVNSDAHIGPGVINLEILKS